MPDEGAWRDLIASLSIVNLWFVKLWLKILPYNAGSSFFLPHSPFNTYLAAMVNVLFAGAALFFLVRFLRKREKLFPWLVLFLFFVTSLLTAYGVGAAFISVARFVFLFGPHSALFLGIACWTVCAVVIYLLVRWRATVAKGYAILPLLFSPYLLVTFSHSVSALAKAKPEAHFAPHAVRPAAPLRDPLGSKVVWIIFDETDYRLGFAKRPASLALPAFDSFRKTAMSATAAYSPNDNTATSLPSLITGMPLKRTKPEGPAGLELVSAGGGARSDFAAQDTVFKEIKRRGGSTALFGWYIPYSRTLKDTDLGGDYARFDYYTSDSFLDVLLHQWREVVDMRFIPFSNTMLGNNQIGIVQKMRADVADAVRNNDMSLMFLHYSVPHSPNIYDRRTGRLGFNRNKREGYLDNLALADRCFADLRSEMERKGSWDSSLVIVSSDHHWRTNTYDQVLDKQHVPFMVKFPHQTTPFTYNGRFNTILTKDLILDAVDKKVKSPEEAMAWLDRAIETGRAPVVISAVQPDAD